MASMGENVSLSSGHHFGASSSSGVANKMEESFGIEYEAGCRSSSTFRLMQVKGLPQWANKGCVTIRGVIQVKETLQILTSPVQNHSCSHHELLLCFLRHLVFCQGFIILLMFSSLDI